MRFWRPVSNEVPDIFRPPLILLRSASSQQTWIQFTISKKTRQAAEDKRQTVLTPPGTQGDRMRAGQRRGSLSGVHHPKQEDKMDQFLIPIPFLWDKSNQFPSSGFKSNPVPSSRTNGERAFNPGQIKPPPPGQMKCSSFLVKSSTVHSSWSN